ncbi:acryloyl-CoA reductase [Rhodococcus sp. B10]|uniref:acrylyl-CoA reductase family protein n=1 Tax=Rhodococcus sp. B10 TaxID=2695876 RepID=UPI00142FCD91|nr:acryloyl-CoA reductase [Rhodococcus sp. B10]NIL78362.1 putative quinone oxidoreductase YhfP [Rhodococcus sp. B10]
MSIPEEFRAFVVDKDTEGEVRHLGAEVLGDGDVTIKVNWSGVNYKDGLASRPGGKVARISPLIPGIDLAGTVVDPGQSSIATGTSVLVHGYDLGVAHHGGFAEYARVPAEWVVRLPQGLTDKEAMSLGTAGFTAGLSVVALEEHGITPDRGPILVTGATGGVGSTAIGILARRGYDVVASTGKSSAHSWLFEVGAHKVVDREETSSATKALQPERWAGVVDCVGGDTLAYALSTTKYGGAVAASGNTGGTALATTVFPFILRGVALLGVDSVQCQLDKRQAIWERLANDLRPFHLGTSGTEIVDLDNVASALSMILTGGTQGRALVQLCS